MTPAQFSTWRIDSTENGTKAVADPARRLQALKAMPCKRLKQGNAPGRGLPPTGLLDGPRQSLGRNRRRFELQRRREDARHRYPKNRSRQIKEDRFNFHAGQTV